MDIEIEETQDEKATAEGAALVRKWMDEIGQALKREKDFRKEGDRINQLYEAQKKAEYQFNILYSNTETLAPALFNSTPRPVVKRRFDDADPMGLLACKLAERSISYLLDTNDPTYSEFDELMQSAVHEALLPGRGVTRFTYEAEFEEVPPVAEGEATGEKVSSETVCGNEVPWDRFLHGYAKKWKDVPWVAYEHQMDRHELKRNFGDELAARVELTRTSEDESDDKTGWGSRKEDAKGLDLACVYEIWDKQTKQVIFICSGYKPGPLKQVEDPLGLSGFFNCPRPLSFFRRVTTLTPKALYEMYEEQAKELNAVTVRINKIVRALKVRGFYDGTLEGLDRLMEADDNTLIPAENTAAMLQGQTLDRAIWLFPLEKLISVLQQLYVQRNQVKQTIYEITGIADIMRGSSQASETLGAQEIKNQWGTLRLKRAQREVARYARDCLRIMAEIAVKKLQPTTLKAMTELPFPTAEEKAKVQSVAAQAQVMGQQLPPEMQSILQQPSLDEILQLLRDDLQRKFRIDIETNSTVDLEATEDKKEIGEFLNAMAQFMNGVAPVVESGAMPFEAAKAILMGVVRKYRFGTDVEDQLSQMQAPQKPEEGEDPAKKAAAEAAIAKSQADIQIMQMELELKREEHRMKMEEMRMKHELMLAQGQEKTRQFQMQQAAQASADNTGGLQGNNTGE